MFWSVAENYRYFNSFDYARCQLRNLGRVLGFRAAMHEMVDPVGSKWYGTYKCLLSFRFFPEPPIPEMHLLGESSKTTARLDPQQARNPHPSPLHLPWLPNNFHRKSQTKPNPLLVLHKPPPTKAVSSSTAASTSPPVSTSSSTPQTPSSAFQHTPRNSNPTCPPSTPSPHP